MPTGTIEALAAGYTSYKAKNTTWYTVVKTHPKTSIALGFLMIMILLFTAILLVKERARRKLVQVAEQKAQEMAVLVEKAQAAKRAKSNFL